MHVHFSLTKLGCKLRKRKKGSVSNGGCGGWQFTKDGQKRGMMGTATLIILISARHYLSYVLLGSSSFPIRGSMGSSDNIKHERLCLVVYYILIK